MRIIAFAVVLLLSITNASQADEANVVTEYTIQCYEGELVGDECVGGYWLTNQQTKYRVLIEQQIVVSWFPGLSEWQSPEKHTNCAIASLDNWTCRYSNNSPHFGFRNGKFFYELGSGTSAEQKERIRKSWGQINVDKERWLTVLEHGDEAILEHRRQQKNLLNVLRRSVEIATQSSQLHILNFAQN